MPLLSAVPSETTILLVEERQPLRQSLARVLRESGYRLEEASDGPEALEISRRKAISLVIVELLLPSMDGFEFVDRLRSLDPAYESVPVILLTAPFRVGETSRMQQAAGVQSVMSRPTEPEALLRTVSELLQGRNVAPQWSSSPSLALRTLDEARATAQQLSALIDFQLDLSQQLDLDQMLDLYVNAARSIVGSQYALAVMLESHSENPCRIVSCGLEKDLTQTMTDPSQCQQLLTDLRQEKETAFRRVLDQNAGMAQFIRQHFSNPHSCLGLTIRTPSRTLGWCCLINRLGESDFTEADERVAATVTTQFAALYENQLLYQQSRMLIEYASDGIVLFDQQGRVLDINPYASEVLGYSRSELLQMHMKQLVDARDHGTVAETFQALQRGETVLRELRIMPRQGHPVEAEMRARMLPDGRIQAIVRDIRQRKARERQLFESEERYRAIFENAPFGIYQTTPGGEILNANAELVRILGYDSVEELLQRDAAELYDDPSERALLHTVLMAEGSVTATEMRLKRKDGQLVWVEEHARVVGSGQWMYFEKFVKDVTQARAALEERARYVRDLRESEERYRNLVEQARDIIYTVSPQGVILNVNSAFQRITGFSPEEVAGQHFAGLLVPDDLPKAEAAYYQVMSGQSHAPTVFRLRTREGGSAMVEAATVPEIRDGSVMRIFGVARDITERRQLERQLEQANRVASLGRVSATMAHEFNNVLMAIGPAVELMRRPGLSHERLEASAERVAAAIHRGRRVTQEILRFTQPAEPVIQAIDLGDCIIRLGQELIPVIGDRYRIDCDLRSGDLWAAVDRQQIEQVLTNLIMNARDAMPRGGTITLRAEKRDGTIHILCIDTGHGMTAEVINHAFDPLFTTKKSGGTGLGLTMALQVVTRHDGRIEIQSTPGHGTTIDVQLPAVRAGATHPAVAPPAQPASVGKPAHLLLVEDDPIVSDVLVTALDAEGVAVTATDSGQAALDQLNSKQFDGVILDAGLPDMSGLEVWEQIARRWPDLPVIISTGHADSAALGERVRGDKVGILQKPYEIRTLLERFSSLSQSGP